MKDSEAALTDPRDDSLPLTKQTPFFRASQAARYRRQEAIKAIQDHTGRKLICYVSEPAGYIQRDDVLPIMDLLYGVGPDQNIDLMLHTLGGDVDAAEKIAGLLLKAVGTEGELRIIVPDCAKSAGTLISLAAQSIVMSDTSELGPIDPQVVTTDPKGNQASRPAQSYIDAHKAMMQQLAANPDSPEFYALVDKFDPVLLDMCEKALARSRKFAERFLQTGMFRGKTGNFTEIASKLSNNAQWLSHGAVVNADDASSIGLNIDYRKEDDREWQAYWRLYCEMRLALEDKRQKLFESDYASLII